LEDGGSAEVFANELSTGCMVALRGITPDLLKFLFDMLEAGKWVMLPTIEEAVAVTTSLEYLEEFPTVFRNRSSANQPMNLASYFRMGCRSGQSTEGKLLKVMADFAPSSPDTTV
jgi:hypothetical protein